MEDKNGMVLIVDDNMQNIQLLGTLIEEAGYNTAIATNGTEAINYIIKELPDLILLDIMMPEIDGFEVCAQIKKNDAAKRIPIIFLTALTGHEDKIRAFHAGAVDYIEKPFLQEEVIARINVHMKLKKMIEKLEDLSIKDEMTGVYNRRFAYEIIARQMEIAKREKSNFSLCYIDIDNLKKMNDTYGHAAGDELITSLSAALQKVVRKTDYIFRMGGDEFIIVFPNPSDTNYYKMIERLKQEINQEKVNDIAVDFSFGFSNYSHTDEYSVDELISQTDYHMYKDKESKKQENND